MDKLKAYHHRPPAAAAAPNRAAEQRRGRQQPSSPSRSNTVKLPAHREALVLPSSSGGKTNEK